MSLDLQALVAEMRALGITQLRTADYEIVLGAAPPPTPTERPAADPEVESVEREKRDWDRFWTRANRSSGTAIPPFPRRPPRVEPER